MDLIVVTRAFWSDVGEANAAREVTKELVKLGVELVTVIHADSNVKGRHEPIPQKTLEPISVDRGILSMPPFYDYRVSARAAKMLKLLRKDLGTDYVIHCHNLVPSAFSDYKSVETDARLFTTVHGMYDDEVKRYFKEMPVHPRELTSRLGVIGPAYFSHFLLKRSKGQIIALSPRNACGLVKLGLEMSRVHVIPNGVDLDFFKPCDKTESRKRLGLPLDKPLVVTISEIQPRKGLHTLIKAARVTTESVPDANFVIVGKVPSNSLWYMAYLQKLLRKLDICKHFRFTGFVPKQELPLYLNAADIFTLPSFAEGAPLVIPSAMACGLLIIATESSEAGYLPQNLVVQNGNARELAERIAHYLSDPKQCRLIGSEMRQRALNELSWTRIAKRTLDLYNKQL
jgi:glycosyltransferase involved in cell wall biosynthesis